METLNELIAESTEPINIFEDEDSDTIMVIATNGWVQEQLKNANNLLKATYPREIDISHTEAFEQIFMTVSASGECGAFLCKEAELIATWFNKKMEALA